MSKKTSRASTPANARDTGPRKLGEVLIDLMARRGYAQVTAAETFQQAWRETVGELSLVTHALDVKRRVLYVLVENSVIMQELTFRKSELLASIQERLPTYRVKEIKFRLGDLN